MDGKSKAIVAHITLIGWVVALVLNSQEKDEFASFYIRQMLGIILMAALSWIPVAGWILGIAAFIFWLMSLIYSIQGETKEVPIVGAYFQDWFSSL